MCVWGFLTELQIKMIWVFNSFSVCGNIRWKLMLRVVFADTRVVYSRLFSTPTPSRGWNWQPVISFLLKLFNKSTFSYFITNVLVPLRFVVCPTVLMLKIKCLTEHKNIFGLDCKYTDKVVEVGADIKHLLTLHLQQTEKK